MTVLSFQRLRQSACRADFDYQDRRCSTRDLYTRCCLSGVRWYVVFCAIICSNCVLFRLLSLCLFLLIYPRICTRSFASVVAVPATQVPICVV